jgi:two-component system response regulator PilR (NtrC family)
VFLDEIADLPLHLQVKLLRVIQERTVRPIGETQEVAVDARFLSATHKDLSALVAQGLFREDLYYRINVIELEVPPLRQRDQDVVQLADGILSRLAPRMGMTVPTLAPDAKDALMAYAFPGNVRELENVLERALALCDGGRIEADDIQVRRPASAPGDREVAADESNDLGGQLEDVERAAIIEALEKTRYNKTRAAKLLGISFRALRYRIKKLGIE